MNEENNPVLRDIINLILTISTRFVNVLPENIDEEITACIAEIGSFTNVDRSYVFFLSSDGTTMSCSFEWCAEGIQSLKDNFQNIPTSMYQRWIDILSRFEPIHISHPSDLTKGSDTEKEMLNKLGIQSILVVPLVIHKKLIDFLGFDNFLKQKFWDQQIITLLEIIAKDIASLTYRKDVYNAHIKSEKKVRNLIQNIPGMVYSASYNWSVNIITNSENICGYSEDNFKNHDIEWIDLIYEEDINRVFEESQALLQEPVQSMVHEYRIVHKNGEIRWVRDHKTSIFSHNGSFIGVDGIVFDITDIKKAEEKIGANQKQLINVLENLPNPVIVGHDGVVSYANPSMMKMLQCDCNNFDQLLRSSILADYYDNIHSALNRQKHTESIEPYELEFENKSGDTETVLIHSNTIDFYNIPSYLFVLTDITQLKKTENLLEVTAFNLRERMKELNCLQLVSNILFRSGYDVKTALSQLLDVIPPAFQFPDITTVNIILRDQIFQNYNFTETSWRLSTPILSNSMEVGRIEIAYLEKRPELSIGPFMSEEQDLLNTIAQRIGKFDELITAHETLQKNEKRLAFTLEITRLGVWEVDWFTKNATRNARHAQIFGYDDLLSEWSLEIFLGHIISQEREYVQSSIQYAIEYHQKMQINFRILRKDNVIRWIAIIGEALYDESDKPIKFLGVVQDITEFKEVEEAIKASEEKFRLVVESAPDAIFIQINGKFSYLNPSACNLFGITSQEQLLGSSVIDRFHPDFRDIVKKRINNLNEDHISVELIEEVMLTFDNTPVDVEVSAVPFFYQNSHGALVFLRDITDRKKAISAMQESEQALSAMINSITEPAFLINTNGLVITANDTMAEWIGLSGKEEIIGKNGLDELKPEIKQFYQDKIAEIVETKKPIRFEDYHFKKSALTSMYPIPDDNGIITRIAVYLLDITQLKKTEEIKIQTENRLKSAMKTGKIAWWEMDMPEGRIRFDDRKATMLGYDPQIFEHYRDFTNLIHPDDLNLAMQSMNNHLKGITEEYAIDYRIRDVSGNYHWYRDVGKITQRYDDKKPKILTGVVMDITKNKLSEEVIRKSEAQYRLLADNISDVPWVLNIKTGTWNYMSPSVERLTGFTVEETLQKTINEVMTQSSYDYLAKALADRISLFFSNPHKKNYYIDEIEQIRKDGSTVWTEVTSKFITNKKGETLVVGVSRDISSRKEAEIALQESKQFFEDVINFLPDPTFVINTSGHILAWNHAMEGLSRIAAQEILGKGNYEYSQHLYGERIPILIDYVLHPDLVDDITEKYSNFREEGSTIIAENKITSPDGQVQFYMIAVSPLFDTRENIIGAIESIRDITELKRTEKDLAELNKNLEKIVLDRTKSLEEEIELRKKAEEDIAISLKEKEMLLKEIHHRVKNNMQVISSLLLLQSQTIQDEYIKGLFKESMVRIKSIALVHEQLYRSDNLSRIDYSDYLRKMFHPLFDAYRTDMQQVKMVIDANPVQITIEKAVPCSLIVNELISNSLKHAFPGDTKGEIHIRFSFDAHTNVYTLDYADNGIGFPEGFNPEKTGSLGMSLIKGLTKQLEGKLEFVLGNGIHYLITFPSKEKI